MCGDITMQLECEGRSVARARFKTYQVFVLTQTWKSPDLSRPHPPSLLPLEKQEVEVQPEIQEGSRKLNYARWVVSLCAPKSMTWPGLLCYSWQSHREQSWSCRWLWAGCVGPSETRSSCLRAASRWRWQWALSLMWSPEPLLFLALVSA